MYAIIETGGKQVKVEVGSQIFVEKLEAEEGSTYTFDKVVLVGGEKTVVGAPFVKGASVVAKVEKQGRGKKLSFSNIVQRKTKELKKVIVKLTLN